MKQNNLLIIGFIFIFLFLLLQLFTKPKKSNNQHNLDENFLTNNPMHRSYQTCGSNPCAGYNQLMKTIEEDCILSSKTANCSVTAAGVKCSEKGYPYPTMDPKRFGYFGYNPYYYHYYSPPNTWDSFYPDFWKYYYTV